MTAKSKAIKYLEPNEHGVFDYDTIKGAIEIAISERTKEIREWLLGIKKKYQSSGYDFREFDDFDKEFKEWLKMKSKTSLEIGDGGNNNGN